MASSGNFCTWNPLNCSSSLKFNTGNLSTDQDMKVAFVTANTNYQVTVRAGGSHVLFQAEEALIGEEDASPAFPTLEDLVTVEVRPSATTDVQVEVFAGLV